MLNRIFNTKSIIRLDDITLEPVNKIVYLGQIITVSPDKVCVIQTKIALA